jgi:hypothetical protein
MYPSVQRAHSAAQILLKGVSKQAAKERKGRAGHRAKAGQPREAATMIKESIRTHVD